jgi:hypothetical protein
VRVSSLQFARLRLQNVQAVAVEQEGVFPEQRIELRDGRMAVGKGLNFELVDGSRDLFGSQFHCSILSMGFLALQRQASRVLPQRTASPQVVRCCRFSRAGPQAHRCGIGEPGDLC